MMYFLVALLPILTYAGDSSVKLEEYEAIGFPYEYEYNGKEYKSHAYLGLPYAQAPVGRLRLKKPLPLPSDSQKIIISKELEPGCLPQEDIGEMFEGADEMFPTSEDCLYLNVITPSTPPPSGTKYPVLVWIHGGAFVYGSSRVDGWQQFARHFNSRGIVVVLLQYRLAFWGFFNLGTRNEGGNFGLWDQAAALKFISNRISSFGGDYKRITVFGDSSGAASAHALSLSPHSNKYFQQTIQSSGSMYNPWSHSLNTIRSSENISKELGCYAPKNVPRTKECLRTKTKSEIWAVLKKWGRQRDTMDFAHWGPILDGEFFEGKSINRLTMESPIHKTLYGFNKGDGLIYTFRSGSSLSSSISRTVDQQASFSKKDFYEHVENYLSDRSITETNVLQIRKLLLDYYSRGSDVSSIPEKFWYTRFTDAQTEGSFAGGQIEEIRNKLKITPDWKQYVYMFDYVNPSHRDILGIDSTYAPHAYQYQYLMDTHPPFGLHKVEANDVELAFTKVIVNAFASFVKYGKPSRNPVTWPDVNDPVHIKYLLLGERVVVEDTHFVEISKLWKKVYALGYGQKVSPLH